MGVHPPPTKTVTTFIDFDDTLFPTTAWETAYAWEPAGATPLPPLTAQHASVAAQCDDMAVQFVQAAAKKGPVYIVSNGTYAWVRAALDAYLPALAARLDVCVISARDVFEAQCVPSQHWKPLMFKALMRRPQMASLAYPTGPPQQDVIVSVGDRVSDAWAAERLVGDAVLFPFRIPTIRTVVSAKAPSFQGTLGQWIALLQHKEVLLASAPDTSEWAPVTRWNLQCPPPTAVGGSSGAPR